MTDNTLRFCGKAEDYDFSRPSYAEEVLGGIVELCGLSAGDSVADVGSGTGIFAQQLLGRGFRVFGVEPNGDMRGTAEKRLADFPGFSSVRGSASHTGLPDGSVRLVTAAQAFHWFSAEEFRAECVRILRPEGFAAVVYNNRAGGALNDALDGVCARRCADFHIRGRENEESIVRFFGGKQKKICAENRVLYDKRKLIGLFLSRSYAPKRGEDGYREFVGEISALFDEYEKDGAVFLPYRSVAYVGKP